MNVTTFFHFGLNQVMGQNTDIYLRSSAGTWHGNPQFKMGNNMIYNGWPIGYRPYKIHRRTLQVSHLNPQWHNYNMYGNKDHNIKGLTDAIRALDENYFLVLIHGDSMAWNGINRDLRNAFVQEIQQFGSAIETLDDVGVLKTHILIGYRGIGKARGIETSKGGGHIERRAKIYNGELLAIKNLIVRRNMTHNAVQGYWEDLNFMPILYPNFVFRQEAMPDDFDMGNTPHTVILFYDAQKRYINRLTLQRGRDAKDWAFSINDYSSLKRAAYYRIQVPNPEIKALLSYGEQFYNWEKAPEDTANSI